MLWARLQCCEVAVLSVDGEKENKGSVMELRERECERWGDAFAVVPLPVTWQRSPQSLFCIKYGMSWVIWTEWASQHVASALFANIRSLFFFFFKRSLHPGFLLQRLRGKHAAWQSPESTGMLAYAHVSHTVNTLGSGTFFDIHLQDE